jgi:hypothetical protein
MNMEVCTINGNQWQALYEYALPDPDQPSGRGIVNPDAIFIAPIASLTDIKTVVFRLVSPPCE